VGMGGGRKWRAGRLPLLSHLKGGVRGGGGEGGEREEQTRPCTKCSHMHIVRHTGGLALNSNFFSS
jgi:hypothetical protein